MTRLRSLAIATSISLAATSTADAQCAVNMLSMDLSRWQDIKVVDDRRVRSSLAALPLR